MNMSKRRINLYFIAIMQGNYFDVKVFFFISYFLHAKKFFVVLMVPRRVDEWARIINFKIATELSLWNLIIPSKHSWHSHNAWLTYFSVQFSWLELHQNSQALKAYVIFWNMTFPESASYDLWGYFCDITWYRMDRKENLPRDTSRGCLKQWLRDLIQ